MFGEARAAKGHRRWWVAGIGLLGSLVLYGGWSFKIRPVLYIGMLLLFTASALTFWAKRHPRNALVQLKIRRRKVDHAQG